MKKSYSKTNKKNVFIRRHENAASQLYHDLFTVSLKGRIFKHFFKEYYRLLIIFN